MKGYAQSIPQGMKEDCREEKELRIKSLLMNLDFLLRNRGKGRKVSLHSHSYPGSLTQEKTI